MLITTKHAPNIHQQTAFHANWQELFLGSVLWEELGQRAWMCSSRGGKKRKKKKNSEIQFQVRPKLTQAISAWSKLGMPQRRQPGADLFRKLDRAQGCRQDESGPNRCQIQVHFLWFGSRPRPKSDRNYKYGSRLGPNRRLQDLNLDPNPIQTE